jgi:acyl carrier protein
MLFDAGNEWKYFIAVSSFGFHSMTREGEPREVDKLRKAIREILMVRLKLASIVEKIDDDTPLFGPEGLGLDSIDALELVLGIQEVFDVLIDDRALAVKVLFSIDTIAEYLASLRGSDLGNAGGGNGSSAQADSLNILETLALQGSEDGRPAN